MTKKKKRKKLKIQDQLLSVQEGLRTVLVKLKLKDVRCGKEVCVNTFKIMNRSSKSLDLNRANVICIPLPHPLSSPLPFQYL